MLKLLLFILTFYVTNTSDHSVQRHPAATRPARLSTLQELKLRQSAMLELLGRVQMEAILNNQMAIKIRRCLDRNNKSQECVYARAQIIEPFKQVVADARMHLLVGYRDQVRGERFYTLNSSMNNLHTYKETAWKRATTLEIQVATRVLNGWKNKASDEASRNRKISGDRAKQDRYVQLKVRANRVANLNAYKEMLSQIILLQPFNDVTATDQNIRAALDVIVQRSQRELQSLARAARYAETWMKDPESCAETVDYQINNPSFTGSPMPAPLAYCINTPSSLASLLDYRGIVAGMSMENALYKKVFESVQSERTARTIGIAALIAIPTLAVCIFAPPLVAIPAGAGAGGLALLQSQHEYNQVKQREISRVINETGDVDWEALKSARLSRNISIVLLPFFGAGRFAGPFLRNSAAGKYLIGISQLKRNILRAH